MLRLLYNSYKYLVGNQTIYLKILPEANFEFYKADKCIFLVQISFSNLVT